MSTKVEKRQAKKRRRERNGERESKPTNLLTLKAGCNAAYVRGAFMALRPPPLPLYFRSDPD